MGGLHGAGWVGDAARVMALRFAVVAVVLLHFGNFGIGERPVARGQGIGRRALIDRQLFRLLGNMRD